MPSEWPVSGSSGYTPRQLLGGEEPDAVMQQSPDGTWTPATSTPLHPGLDFEVSGTGPYAWEAWDGMRQVATGHARTRLGLQIALLRAKRKHSRTA